MNIDEARGKLSDLTDTMDKSVEGVHNAAMKAQQLIYEALAEQVSRFEISQGNFVYGQDFSQRFAIIDKRIKSIINRVYIPDVKGYLRDYKTIEDTTVNLHKSYNELQIDKQLLTPAKRAVYDQAEYYLTEGLADAYIQPAKYLLMQQVASGASIKQAQSLLKQWNEGEITSGKLTSARPTPRLQAYSLQIARDSMFQYNGVIQDIIGKEYGLTKFIYVGGLVSDSRPFCRHLVGLKRKIDLDEIPPLVEKYPQGLIPNTTKKTFPIWRGGYNCRHTVMMVKG